MKLKKNMLLLFIALILLITTFVIYSKKDSSVNADSSVKKIWDINQKDIVEISMENKDGKFVFQKSEEQWKAVEPVNFKFDTMRIDGILYTLVNLQISNVVDENPKDIEQYGLIKPSSVTIKLQNGKLNTLEIGNVTALRDGYYVKVKNESTVYKVNTGVGEELLRGKKEFRDNRLFNFVGEEFIRFQIKEEDKILLRIEKDGNGWKVEPPVEGNVDIKRLEPLISTFSYLCVNDYIEDEVKDLDEYGLNRPSYTIDLKTTKFNKILYLGNSLNKDNEEYIYAKIDESNDVFILKRKDISFIDNPSRSGFNFSE